MSNNPTWRKSSRSNAQSACVEITGTFDAVRDSKNPNGARLRGDVLALVSAVKQGTVTR